MPVEIPRQSRFTMEQLTENPLRKTGNCPFLAVSGPVHFPASFPISNPQRNTTSAPLRKTPRAAIGPQPPRPSPRRFLLHLQSSLTRSITTRITKLFDPNSSRYSTRATIPSISLTIIFPAELTSNSQPEPPLLPEVTWSSRKTQPPCSPALDTRERWDLSRTGPFSKIQANESVFAIPPEPPSMKLIINLASPGPLWEMASEPRESVLPSN